MKRVHPILIGLIWAAFLIVAGLLLTRRAHGATYLSSPQVGTIADLTNRVMPATGLGAVPVHQVMGIATPGDWGEPKAFQWDRTNTLPANAARRAVSGMVTGRMVHPWTDRDARVFGVQAYEAPEGPTPWLKRLESAPVGSGAFSFAIRFKVPTPSSQSIGLLSVNRSLSTDGGTNSLNASLEVYRGSGTEFSILVRNTNSSSAGGGSTTLEAGKLQASNSLIDAYAGQTVDLVVTRSGTNWQVYLQGTNVTASFAADNLAGLGKSIGSGDSLDWLLGTTVANDWIWPEPITRFALWTSTLSSGQAADPWGTSGKVIDHQRGTFPTLTDQAPAIQAAIDYAHELGGGQVRLPVGKIYIATPIRLRADVHLVGAGAPAYPGNGNRPTRGGPTVLVLAHGMVGTAIIGARDYADPNAPFLTTRALWALGNGVVSSRFMRSSVQDLTIDGSMAYAARGIWFDRVGAASVRNVSFWHVPGAPIYATAGNCLQFVQSWGQTHRGIITRGVSDSFIGPNVWIDGAAGPALWNAGNGVQVGGNSTFEFSRNPRSAPVFEQTITVDTGTDTITAVGHRYLTGDPIRFLNEGGALPGGLSANTDYFVIRLGADTFRVSTKYIDEVTGGGALNSADVVDITSTGSGTHYSTVGPSVGILGQGDGNTYSSLNVRGSWDSGIRLETLGENTVIGNNINLSGYQNPARTNGSIGAIQLIASPRNRIHANKTDDRENVLGTQFGIIADAASVESSIQGNSADIATPYTFAGTGNWWSDGTGAFFPGDGGTPRIYLPSTATFANLDPLDRTNTFTLQLARDRYRMHASIDGSATNWWYSPLLPSQTTQWSWTGAGNGGMAMVNNGAGAGLFFISGAYSSSQEHRQVNSATAGEGYRRAWVRNAGTNSSTFAAIPANAQIAYDLFGGFWGTGANDYHFGAAWEYLSLSPFTSSTAHTRAILRLAPTNSTTLAAQLDVRDPIATPSTSLSIKTAESGTLQEVKRDPTSGVLYTGTLGSLGGGGTNGVSDGNKGAIGVSGGGTNWQINAAVVHSTNIIDGTITTNDLAAAAHAALRSPDFGAGIVSGASFRAVPVALGAGTVLTNGTYYTATLSANRTVTFSGTPAEGQVIGLYVNATAVATLTFPSSVDGAGGSTVTTKLLQVGRHELSWRYQASEWVFSGTPVLDNLAATGAPTTGDDAADGYSITSRWYDTTSDREYVCLDATVGAAVWRLSTPIIGTDVQAYDAELAAIAGIGGNGILAKTGAGAAAVRTITGTASEVTVTNGDGVSGNPTLSLPSTLDLTGKTVNVATQSGSVSNDTAASTAFVQQKVAGLSGGGGSSGLTGLAGRFFIDMAEKFTWAGTDFTNDLAAIAASTPAMKGARIGPYEFDGSGSAATPLGGVAFNSGSAAYGPGYLGRPGIYSIGTSASTNGGGTISSGDQNSFILPTNYVSSWVVAANFPSASTANDIFGLEIGWHDASTASATSPTDAVMANYNSATSTNWMLTTLSNSSGNNQDSIQAYPLADTWGKLSAILIGTNQAKLYWNGTVIATNAVSIPNGNSRGLRLSIKIRKLGGNTGTTAKSLLVDYADGFIEGYER